MQFGCGAFSKMEIECAIEKMRGDRASDESGMVAEYLKALKKESVEDLRGMMNEVLNGANVPKEWKESRVVLIHKGGNAKELKNYRPIAIISVVCKLCMMIVKDRINEWVEETGMLGDIQGGFRRGRRTEDNLFMLERIIEMTKGRDDKLYVAFLDMEKSV